MILKLTHPRMLILKKKRQMHNLTVHTMKCVYTISVTCLYTDSYMYMVICLGAWVDYGLIVRTKFNRSVCMFHWNYFSLQRLLGEMDVGLAVLFLQDFLYLYILITQTFPC